MKRLRQVVCRVTCTRLPSSLTLNIVTSNISGIRRFKGTYNMLQIRPPHTNTDFLADIVSTICSDASAYLPSDYQFSLKPPTLTDDSVFLLRFPPEPMSYSYVTHVYPGALSDV